MIKQILETIEMNETFQNLGNNALVMNDKLTFMYKPDQELKDSLDEYDTDNMEDKILFVYSLKEGLYFDAVFAQKGFGPIAYMVAMQQQGQLAPYWMESQVTPAAQKIWKEFFNGKGEKFVNKELNGVDPKNYRHYVYSLKKPLNLSKNLKINDRFLENDEYGEKQTMILELADSLLQNSMESIYRR